MAQHRTAFFVAISAAMLVIVLVGFGPTLYLRPLFGVPPIPDYLYVHGALLTGWFAIVVGQTALVRRGQIKRHRQLGIVGVCVGVAVVVASVIVTLGFVGRVMHEPVAADINLSVMMGFGADPPLLGLAATAMWGNLTSLATFAVLLGCAVFMRSRSDVHKRLMVLASLSILPPRSRASHDGQGSVGTWGRSCRSWRCCFYQGWSASTSTPAGASTARL